MSTKKAKPPWRRLMDIIDYSKDERLKWLRYVLRTSGKAPAVSDWHTLYDFADKQKIIGVCDPTRHVVQIDLEVLSLWMGAALQISDCNTLLNKRAVELWQVLKQAGFRCCILRKIRGRFFDPFCSKE